MADAVNQSTLKQVVVPAAAAAVVVLLIGMLVWGSSFSKKPEGGKAGPAAPGRVSVPATDLSDTGMSEFAAVPAVDSPEWKDFGDGLKIQDAAAGEGDVVCPPGATVTIHYTGWLTDGKQFDSSRTRGKPATFPLADLVRGWQVGIPGMKPGGVRRLLIPYPLGYGKAGKPPTIPPEATLIFEIKMLGFEG